MTGRRGARPRVGALRPVPDPIDYEDQADTVDEVRPDVGAKPAAALSRADPGPGVALVLWTTADVCAALQCRPSWLYDEVEAGRFPVVRLGRQLRFRPADITAWIDSQHHPAREAATPMSVRPRHRRRPSVTSSTARS